MRHYSRQGCRIGNASNQPPRPNCPALIICQKTQSTPQRLINIAGMMNAFVVTEFPADVTFAVHFALREGRGKYHLALILGTPDYPNIDAANRHLLWEGEASLRAPSVVHEQPLQITTRFLAPGQFRIEIYANGEQVALRRLSILKTR